MQLTITGYSTALFSTWYFVEEWGILFDAGDGLISALLQKSRKIDHVFISHADRDHLTGLLQFNQLNARPGYPIIHYPKDAGSFPVLGEFSRKFDPQERDSLSMEVRTNLLVYSGDTPVEDGAKWDNTGILIHEATFLGNGEQIKERGYGNKHSTLEEVMEMVSTLHLGTADPGAFFFQVFAGGDRESHQRPLREIRDQYPGVSGVAG